VAKEREEREAERGEFTWQVESLEMQLQGYLQRDKQNASKIEVKDDQQAASDYLIEALRRELETERAGR
jgi:hypothetical protein